MKGREGTPGSRKRAVTPIQTAETRFEAVGNTQQSNPKSNSKMGDQDNRKECDKFKYFDLTPLKAVLKHRQIPNNASIPSPLSSSALEWQHTENSLFDRAQDLYQDIFRQRHTLLEEVRTEAKFHGPGRSKGLLCWWEYLEAESNDSNGFSVEDSDEESDEESIEGELNYAWVDETMDLDIHGLKVGLKGKHKASKAHKVLNICRFQRTIELGGAQPGEFRHFIAHFDRTPLAINGIPIGSSTLAGPLPEFAVIEIKGSLLFWWGSAAALDFVPEANSANNGKRSFSDSQEYENLADNHPLAKRPKNPGRTNSKSGTSTVGGQPAGQNRGSAGTNTGFDTSNSTDIVNLDSTSRKGTGVTHGGKQDGKARAKEEQAKKSKPPYWETMLDEGLRRHAAKAKRKGAFKVAFNTPTALLDEHVHNAIASVWEGLRQFGIFYAFGTLFTFRANRAQDSQMLDSEAVLGPHPLIIPLFLGREMPAKKVRKSKNVKRTRKKDRAEPIGHHLLAVVGQPKDETVNVLIYDSAPGVRSHEEIQNAVGGLIRNTGWMGIDAAGGRQPVTPTIKYFDMPTPLQQGQDTCGFYQILNAWAIMLGIPIHPGQQRRTATHYEKFLLQGVLIFNLAMNGCMDSTTIEAFMNVHGYSAENLKSPLEPQIDAVEMDDVTLDNIMEELRTRGRAAVVQRTATYSDEVIAAVMGVTQADENTVIDALRLHNGATHAATAQIMDDKVEAFGAGLKRSWKS